MSASAFAETEAGAGLQLSTLADTRNQSDSEDNGSTFSKSAEDAELGSEVEVEAEATALSPGVPASNSPNNSSTDTNNVTVTRPSLLPSSSSSTALAIANFRPTSKDVISGIAPHVFDERRTKRSRSRSKSRKRRTPGYPMAAPISSNNDSETDWALPSPPSRRPSLSRSGSGKLGPVSTMPPTLRRHSSGASAWYYTSSSPLRLSAVITVEDLSPDDRDCNAEEKEINPDDLSLRAYGSIDNGNGVRRKRSSSSRKRVKRSPLESLGIGKRKMKKELLSTPESATPKQTRWSLLKITVWDVQAFRYVQPSIPVSALTSFPNDANQDSAQSKIRWLWIRVKDDHERELEEKATMTVLLFNQLTFALILAGLHACFIVIEIEIEIAIVYYLSFHRRRRRNRHSLYSLLSLILEISCVLGTIIRNIIQGSVLAVTLLYCTFILYLCYLVLMLCFAFRWID